MDIHWEFTLKQQLKNYKFCARQIHHGFYQKLRFYVLPFLPKKFRGRVVFFPYVESFSKYFRNMNSFNMQTNIPEKIEKDIQKSLNELYEKYLAYVMQKKSEFCQIKKEFKKQLENQFPKVKNFKFIIHPSILGSVGFYDYKDKEILIYPRFDREVSSICKLLITASTHLFQFSDTVGKPDMKMLKDKSWFIKQKKANDIARYKNFQSTIKNKKGMLNILRSNFTGNLVLESCKYFEKLGYPIESELKNINKLKDLTNSEERILKLFIANRKKIITFEQIGNILWGNRSENKYSLYAIAKHIERLRNKLTSNGLKINLIHTQRGKGYVLYD